MELIVNDTNILIDLVEMGLIGYCREMEIEFHTTKVVIAELIVHEQKMTINKLIDEGILIVDEFKGSEVMQFALLYADYSLKSNLTPPDCSVMMLAEKLNCRLLTSDQKLKHHAEERNIKVNGLLWLTDKMVDDMIVDSISMIDHLQKWLEINNRAPHKHIMDRIEKYWKGRND